MTLFHVPIIARNDTYCTFYMLAGQSEDKTRLESNLSFMT